MQSTIVKKRNNNASSKQIHMILDEMHEKKRSKKYGGSKWML